MKRNRDGRTAERLTRPGRKASCSDSREIGRALCRRRRKKNPKEGRKVGRLVSKYAITMYFVAMNSS